MEIRGRKVGDGAPSYIVAEVGQAHDGSYALAHAYIDAVAEAGADAVKFQCHIAEAESTPDEKWRVEPRWRQDASRFDYWRRMEFKPQQWRELQEHAHQMGLGFIVSPFSVEAVRMLAPLVDAWKVASGEVENEPLLEAIRADGKPIIVSTGMTPGRRYWGAAELACTSVYPCPPELIRLPSEGDWWDGLSDHSGTIWPAIVYAAMGWGGIIEVHVTLARGTGLLDETSSITIAELRQMVEGVRFVERMGKATPQEREERLKPMRELFLNRWKRKAPAEVTGTPSRLQPGDVPASASGGRV
ncbi:MAG: N-acetylneuraminate synthase family protein [Rhodospirillaceae bacterium]